MTGKIEFEMQVVNPEYASIGELKIMVRDGTTPWTPYTGYAHNAFITAAHISSEVHTKVMWGVEHNEQKFGFYATRNSCWEDKNCMQLNSAELAVDLPKQAISGYDRVEITFAERTFVAFSTFSTNLVSETGAPPKCTGTGTRVTCFGFLLIDSSAQAKFWVKFAFHQNTTPLV